MYKNVIDQTQERSKMEGGVGVEMLKIHGKIKKKKHFWVKVRGPESVESFTMTLLWSGHTFNQRFKEQ